MKRRNGTKGFTLVEVIVVLVILAILAAIMIPAMTGWIDKAQQQKYVADARLVYTAAQSAISEQYALNANFSEAMKYNYNGTKDVGRITSNMLYRIQNNRDVPVSTDQLNDVAVARQVLKYLESDGANPRYSFKSQTGPRSGQKVSDYAAANKNQPGIVILYDKTGTVKLMEFGYDDCLVHIEDGNVTVTNGDEAKFSAKGLDK